LIEAALLGLVAAAVAAPCPVERLPAEPLRAGDDAVERYRETRRLQFEPDLMGYRDGPALGPPAAKERDLDFRTRVQNSTRPVHRYVDRCAHRVSGGIHIGQGHPRGIHVVVSVVGGRARHVAALGSRYRFRGLLRVRRVRFTERRLRSVQDRVGDDFGELRALGVDVRASTLVIARNRVLVGVKEVSRRDRRLLRRRYGPAVVSYRFR
jgi:hypothetical protein